MKLEKVFLCVYLSKSLIFAYIPNSFHRRKFVFGAHCTQRKCALKNRPLTFLSSSLVDENNDIMPEEPKELTESRSNTVRAPLKFIGPYPCLPLRFPDLSTSAQRARNETGVSLDFVLDTAANTNTIQAQVAAELNLTTVGTALPGFGAAGSISGGDTFSLGDCEIDGLPKESRFTLMTGLLASALPVASPAAAGLLSSAFLNCFPGGVKFSWIGEKDENGVDYAPPSVTFYGEPEDIKPELEDMVHVPIQPLPLTLLPSVMLEINGLKIPALLDTGSPVTVLNAKAADMAGISRINISSSKKKEGSFNPFSNMMQNLKSSQEMAQAAARGDILLIADATGEQIVLNKSEQKLDIGLKMGEDDTFHFGNSHVYVGDLPGLAALGGLEGSESPPAAILGMDVIKLRSKMIYCGQSNNVFFSSFS